MRPSRWPSMAVAGLEHGLRDERHLGAIEDFAAVRGRVGLDDPGQLRGDQPGVVEGRGAGDDAVEIVRKTLGRHQAHATAGRATGEIRAGRRLAVKGAHEVAGYARGLGDGAPAPIRFRPWVVERPAAVGDARARVPGIRRGRRIAPAQAVIECIDDAGAVGVERAAEATAARHVELAVPAGKRQAQFEADRLWNGALHAAVRREIAGGCNRRCGRDVCTGDNRCRKGGARVVGGLEARSEQKARERRESWRRGRRGSGQASLQDRGRPHRPQPWHVTPAQGPETARAACASGSCRTDCAAAR